MAEVFTASGFVINKIILLMMNGLVILVHLMLKMDKNGANRQSNF